MKLIKFCLLAVVLAAAFAGQNESRCPRHPRKYPRRSPRRTKSKSSIGTLEYKDGAPSKETVAKVYDYLDLMHGVEAFVNAYQGASVAAIFKGFEDAGVPNNTALIFSELMDSKSLFLTANADTIYFWVNLDVTKGPMVVETPPTVARRDRRHVVPLGHRLRSARSRPGRGRQVSVRAARLQGRVAGAAATSSQKLRTTRATMLGRSLSREERPEAGRSR